MDKKCGKCGCELDPKHDRITQVGFVSWQGGIVDNTEQGSFCLCKDCAKEFVGSIKGYLDE